MALTKTSWKKGDTTGRPKGVQNEVTKTAKEMFINIMEGQVPQIEDALQKTKEKDPARYLDVLSRLMPYFMPKQVDIKSNGNEIKQVFQIGNTVIEL